MSERHAEFDVVAKTSVEARSEELLAAHRDHISRRTDRLFTGLLLAQWAAGILVALVISPRAWTRTSNEVHPHLITALVVGGLIMAPPAWLALQLPGRAVTRHVVATAQVLFGALLIHLTGGRVETHFFVFGSLAFLAFYRDWRVLITATVVVTLDHLLRGLFWPQSVYGVLTASVWRTVEHAGWIVFENVFLVASCVQGQREMREIAHRHARLETQAEIEAAAAAAHEASRSKSEFLANMSHEIRTPMTAVIGYADLLLDSRIDASDRLNYVQTIRRNGEHLLSIINDILDLSKIEAGKMTTEALRCSPAQIIVDVTSLMRVRALEKNLLFEVRYLTSVPETIHSDPTRIRQILMNLVGNAIKFTASGCVRILVSCSTENDADISFTVADTGIGMSPDELTRVFEPFTQADSSTTRRFGGTGLGLAICKRLAEILGGSLKVESSPGRGSAFTLTVQTGSLVGIRRIESLEEAGVPTTALLPIEATLEPLRGRILLAEDGPDNQVLISTHLRRAGHDVTVAENGRIAVERALEAMSAGHAFDLILMDMQMPELDGYGATAKLRSKGYERPIVALTAHAMTGDRERCIRAGCDDYLTKPIQGSVLLAKVTSYLSMAGVSSSTGQVNTPSSAPLASDYSDDPDMSDLIDDFVSGLVKHVTVLGSAIAEGQMADARRLAHQLKGAAGGYGFQTITTAASRVEAAVSSKSDAAGLTRDLDDLLRLCRRAQRGRNLRAAEQLNARA